MKKKDINKLIKHYEELVSLLVNIAEDPKVAPGVLRKLSELNDSWIQTCVSLHPKTPSGILVKMLTRHSAVAGEDEQWRIHILGNPAIPLNAVERAVVRDPSPEVRETASIALAMRIAQLPNIGGNKLLNVYATVINNSLQNSRRRKLAIRALLNHPRFPKYKGRRTSNKKRRGEIK